MQVLKRVAGLVSIEQMQRNKFCCEKMIVSPAVTFPYSAQATSWSRALLCIIMLLAGVLSPDIETTHHASSPISLRLTDVSHGAEANTNLSVASPISSISSWSNPVSMPMWSLHHGPCQSPCQCGDFIVVHASLHVVYSASKLSYVAPSTCGRIGWRSYVLR